MKAPCEDKLNFGHEREAADDEEIIYIDEDEAATMAINAAVDAGVAVDLEEAKAAKMLINGRVPNSWRLLESIGAAKKSPLNKESAAIHGKVAQGRDHL